ncbi:malto-oligosyltrehalose trehalohydrolase [Luteimicrobium sp. DT211]|uniref:malto-oligosyltrehalose trehalohydrolase n=1 Tax=Luteimicrobium sp. DT211 TaxID=3393412 RepID=UPI003CE9206A
MRPAVWAPSAGAVALVLPRRADRAYDDAARVPMSPDPDRAGWWSAPDALEPGTDYAFALDDGPPRPDPRSARQPYGVDGPSRVVDVHTFPWTDDAWPGRDVRGQVVYELHVGTFTSEGTLDAAAGRLGHLVELGVGVVELMPVNAFGGRWGWGYDGVALWAVHEPYGGPEALARFVDAAHGRGLAVALDVVYNHLGPAGNYLPEFGPYFTDAHHTPWGPAVNLDGPGSSEVRAWIVENACRWLRDFHVDALRLDAVHALVDDSPRHLLAELSDVVATLSAELERPLSLIAESDRNDPATTAPTAEGGLGMTAQWADDVHHAVHAFLTGERHGYYVDFGSVPVLAKALTGVFVHDGGWSTFRDRPWGRPLPPGRDGHAFVVFAQDHDQVGNRALGDRPSASLDPGGLAAAAALVLVSPFTPMLFMGEEWGASTPWQYFTDHADPELGRAVREGRRGEFGGHGWEALYGGRVDVPDPQDHATRDASVLDWAEKDSGLHAALHAWYRRLVALRREPAVASGDLGDVRVTSQDGDATVVVARPGVVVALTRASSDVRVPLPPSAGGWTLAAAWDGRSHVDGEGGDAAVVLGAGSVAVLLASDGGRR